MRCPPDCRGIHLGGDDYSGCTCRGPGCDCPNHPRLVCCCLSCSAAAEFQITFGRGPNDFTHACSEHVGEMLTDASEQHVHRIASEDSP